MLTAKNQEGMLITLPEKITKEALKVVKENQEFYCPCCESELIIKAGDKKIPHFAHKKNPLCTASSEAESAYHLTGKRQLFNWLQKNQIPSQLEAYLPDIKQRADILVTSEKGVYAVEFQCSVISVKDFVKRTALYLEIGVIPIWILAEKNLRKDKANAFMLSAFHWQFLNETFKRPLIITFCPEKGHMGFLQHLTPFSARTTYAAFVKVKLTLLRPCTLPVINEPLILKNWFAKRKNWSLFSMRRITRKDRYYAALYNNSLSPGTLPFEIGLPVKGMWVIETPAVKWQGWLYMDVLYTREKGELITFNQVLSAFRKRQRKGDIKLRSLALLPYLDCTAVIKEYLHLLKELGHLKEEAVGIYSIRELIQIPQNDIEVENLEKSLYLKLTK